MTATRMSILLWCSFLWCALVSVPLLDGQEHVESSVIEAPMQVARIDTTVDRSAAEKSLLALSAVGFKVEPAGAGQQFDTRNSRSIAHGVIGATIGGITGGTLGYLRMLMYCETPGRCDATRDVLIGAAVGATIGVVVEYFIRHGGK